MGFHDAHHGNHQGYPCGFSGPHCWDCNEPWPCRGSRGLMPITGGRVEVRSSAGIETLVPGERLDIFRGDGSRIGTLVYGTPEEVDAAERRLAAAEYAADPEPTEAAQ